jgi:hypothetical protein
MIAIDPGEHHCGVAVFRVYDGDGTKQSAACVFTAEYEPEQLFDWLGVGGALYGNSRLQFDVMVCEEFKLYPEKMKSLAWSELKTVEVIGVLRERCRNKRVQFVLQPASIKKATFAQMKRKDVAFVSRGSGGHCKDAEAHGWHYVWTVNR